MASKRFLMLCAGMVAVAAPAYATVYDITWSGTVNSTNLCAPSSSTDCYVRLNDTVSGTFRYSTGAPGLTTPNSDFYKNLMTNYTLSIPHVSYSGSYSDPGGYGRFVVSRDTASQATATASTFAAYVAKDAGNYTFLGGTNTVNFTPRIPTTSAVASDNIYGDLAISEIRVNFAALSPIFADLQVPTTFSFADLSPSVSNFAVGIASDFLVGNQAAGGFGGGLTSVTVTPVGSAAVPEPVSAALVLTGLAGLAGIRTRARPRH